MGTLGTLDAKKADLFLVWPEDVTLVTDPTHPLYDERVEWPIDEGMVLNIMVHGVIEPIELRRNGEEKGTPILECLNGRQRTRNACEANRRLRKEGNEPHRIPAIIKRGEDHRMFGMMVSANEFRKDSTPMIRAKQMGRYLEMGRSEEEAAILWGVSVATVRNRLALLDLAPQIQKAVESGIVGATLAAKEFANIPREEQPARLAELEAAGTLKGADAKENIRRLRNAKPAKEAKARMQTRDAIEAARKRLRKAGTEDALLARDVLKWAIGEGCSTDIPTRVAEALEPEEETAE